MKDKSVHNIDRNLCTGCMMCSDICGKNAINFKFERGFWFPHVNEELCINCGLCSKKCPVLSPIKRINGPLYCYGAKSKDEQIRWNSTSGGFFTELSSEFINQGGYCAGAVYDEDNEIVHSLENTKDGISKLRQSKYVQSNTKGIYKQVKSKLVAGENVLFCGTACQVEALKSFLGKEYDNLLTMDFVCLGICSPIVYRKYLNLMEKKYKSKISRVWFKNKKEGWRAIGTRLEFANGKSYFRIGSRDLFMVAFVGDSIAMRKSCETCKFRKIPHNSDFTVADFWGIEKVNPTIDDNKGLSAVFVNTEKGKVWFYTVSSKLEFFETTSENITKGNFSALTPKIFGKNRDIFLDSLSSIPLDKAIKLYGEKYSGFNKIKVDLNYYKSKFSNIIKKLSLIWVV